MSSQTIVKYLSFRPTVVFSASLSALLGHLTFVGVNRGLVEDQDSALFSEAGTEARDYLLCSSLGRFCANLPRGRIEVGNVLPKHVVGLFHGDLSVGVVVRPNQSMSGLVGVNQLSSQHVVLFFALSHTVESASPLGREDVLHGLLMFGKALDGQAQPRPSLWDGEGSPRSHAHPEGVAGRPGSQLGPSSHEVGMSQSGHFGMLPPSLAESKVADEGDEACSPKGNAKNDSGN
jgi:hypothetical protein